MGLGLGFMLAGAMSGGAKAAGEIADSEIRRRDDLDSAMKRFQIESDMKLQLADKMMARDSAQYNAARDRVKEADSSRRQSLLMSGMDSGPQQNMPDQLIGVGDDPGFDPTTVRNRARMVDELRAGGASGSLIQSADKDYQNAIMQQKADRAAELADRRLSQQASEGEANRQAATDREQMRIDARAAENERKAAIEGEYTSLNKRLDVVENTRKDLQSRRAAAERARIEDLKSAYSPKDKAAVNDKYAEIFKGLDQESASLKDDMSKITSRLNEIDSTKSQKKEQPQSNQGKTLSSLPTNAYKGKRMLNNKTGKVITFDGTVWRNQDGTEFKG